ncbi:MAG TPA: TonB family protein [Terriglobales bacterium]|nr:TonB family protein [Terriglobales bacterium]
MGTAAELSRILPPVTEQRLSVRKRLSGPFPIELFPGHEVLLSELSEGGLSVTSSSRLEVGAVARINFQIPETDSEINATGVVAWSDSSGRAGVRFTNLESHSSAALSRWVAPDTLGAQAQSAERPSTDSALAAKITGLREIADLKTAISLQQMDRDASLQTIVQRMVALTRATGAAIALREGPDVVCRASAGNAPDVGVKLSTSSLSGECLRTGNVVLLEDSENDPRVNPEICRQLNFRSLLIVPIIAGSESLGIAEVLSPQPHNFEGSDILILTFLADLLAGIDIQNAEIKQAETSDFTDAAHFGIPFLGESETDFSPSGASIAKTDPSSVARELPIEPETGIQPIARNGNSRTSEVPRARENVAPSAPVPTHALGQGKAAATRRANALAALAPHIRSGRRIGLLPIAIGAIILIAVLALLFGYVLPRSSNSAKAANGAPITAEKPIVAPVASPASNSELKPAATATKAARSGAAHPSTASSASNGSAATNASDAKHPDGLDELQVVQRSSSLSGHAVETVPDAPAISQITNRSNGMLPASIIAANTATPELSPVQSQGVTEGKLVRKVLPRYPEMARRAGVSGDVIINATIATDGTLRNLKVTSGSPLLREEALTAAKQWRYSPYKLGGKPIETETRITVSFHR